MEIFLRCTIFESNVAFALSPYPIPRNATLPPGLVTLVARSIVLGGEVTRTLSTPPRGNGYFSRSSLSVNITSSAPNL